MIKYSLENRSLALAGCPVGRKELHSTHFLLPRAPLHASKPDSGHPSSPAPQETQTLQDPLLLSLPYPWFVFPALCWTLCIVQRFCPIYRGPFLGERFFQDLQPGLYWAHKHTKGWTEWRPGEEWCPFSATVRVAWGMMCKFITGAWGHKGRWPGCLWREAASCPS